LDEPYGLFLVYYEQVDKFSQLFMKHAPARLDWISEEDHARYRDVVSEWYAYQDEQLGRLLALIDLDTTAVFVLSDHGFKSGERRIRSEQAVAEFEKALTLHPHDADALLGLSGIAALRGNRARAEHLAKAAVASNPDFPPALAQLAELRRDAGDLGEAIRLYRQALELGDCLQRAGKYDEAESAFTRVLELDPDSFSAHYNLGVTAFQQGRGEEAIARYERALELDPRHPLAAAALNNLGTVHLDRGEIDQAISHWEQAVEASPAQFEARYDLAAQYLDEGRLHDAISLLEQAARLAPNHETLHTRLARAYMEKGRGEDAHRALSLVRRLYPDNWFAPLGMAVLFAATE
jgi:tetratricopeptide (TPR) repeat protein